MESLAVRLFKTREEIIDPTKWGKGLYSERPGTLCLKEAASKHQCEYDIRKLLTGRGPITVWNDHPSRTHKEVIELLNKAISKELGI